MDHKKRPFGLIQAVVADFFIGILVLGCVIRLSLEMNFLDPSAFAAGYVGLAAAAFFGALLPFLLRLSFLCLYDS